MFVGTRQTEASHYRRQVVSLVTAKATKPGYSHAIRWPQSVLQRAAAAIREARSNDCIIMAKAALMAAIRNEVDLLELLPDPPPAKPAPQRQSNGAPAPLEIHA